MDTYILLPGCPPLTIKEIIFLVEEEAKKWFDEIKKVANKKGIRLKTEFIVTKKSVLSTMIEYTEEQNINLIVVETRDQSGIKNYLEVLLQDW